MAVSGSNVRQLVDWSAAIWAGLIAGGVFLLLNLFLLPLVIGGNAWVMLRLLSSIVLGPSVLAPPASYDGLVLVVALIVHFALSIGFALLLAVIIHRWGLLTGIVLGGFFGFALFLINFYTFTLFFPWFFAMNSWFMLWSHVLFGALAGGVYEALEVEEYVVV